jgi:transposase InsO family protein
MPHLPTVSRAIPLILYHIPQPSRFEPAQRLRATGRAQGLSREARTRLEWFIWYHAHGGNARATCRHFGIAPKVFYHWKKQFNEKNLCSLENRSRRPLRLRQWSVTAEQAERILALRREYLRYSKLKLAVLYERRYGEKISSWKVQRVIQRHQLYPNPKRAENTAKKRRLAWKKKRITELVQKPKPGFLVGIDTIVLWLHGHKRYVLTAVDRYSRLAFARMYTSHSSLAAADFLRRLRILMGQDFVHVQTDNGSEFHKHFDAAARKLRLQHVWSRVKTPKDNAVVERFNRTLREEFLDLGNAYADPEEFNRRLTEWLIEYNFHRPHAALGYRCPIHLLENTSRVLPMYPSCTPSCASASVRVSEARLAAPSAPDVGRAVGRTASETGGANARRVGRSSLFGGSALSGD